MLKHVLTENILLNFNYFTKASSSAWKYSTYGIRESRTLHTADERREHTGAFGYLPDNNAKGLAPLALG